MKKFDRRWGVACCVDLQNDVEPGEEVLHLDSWILWVDGGVEIWVVGSGKVAAGIVWAGFAGWWGDVIAKLRDDVVDMLLHRHVCCGRRGRLGGGGGGGRVVQLW